MQNYAETNNKMIIIIKTIYIKKNNTNRANTKNVTST